MADTFFTSWGLAKRSTPATYFINFSFYRSMSGVFITFEGTDGSGKTTQALRLVERLREQGREVVHVREPGGTPIAEGLRSILKSPDFADRDGVVELLMLSAARRDLVNKVVLPSLGAGKIVVCDRFVMSTYAYQGGGRGVAKEDIDAVTRVTVGDLVPDMTVLLDISPYQAAQRRGARDEGADPFEVDDVLSGARGMYREMAARMPNVALIDAGGSIEEVEERVWRALEPVLGRHLGALEEGAAKRSREFTR